VGEFFGNAHFAHPAPAPLQELSEELFPGLLDDAYEPVLVPDVYGETIADLHERVAYVLAAVLEKCDGESNGPKTILICTHAACMIALGRVLTGRMPGDPATDDFQCFTASLSVYKRKMTAASAIQERWDSSRPRHVPTVEWKGVGVAGGWTCEANSDCSYLSGGEERGW
jgi:transcription factor C subunit 7